MGKRLYVGNLNYQTTEEALRDAFGAQGEVASVEIIAEKGFGFVEFANETDAEKAKRALNGTVLDGRCIRVDDAKEKPGRPGKPKRSDGDKPGEECSIVPLRRAIRLEIKDPPRNDIDDYFRRWKAAAEWMRDNLEFYNKDSEFARLAKTSDHGKLETGDCRICGKTKKLRWVMKIGDEDAKVCNSKCVLSRRASTLEFVPYGTGFGLTVEELSKAWDSAKRGVDAFVRAKDKAKSRYEEDLRRLNIAQSMLEEFRKQRKLKRKQPPLIPVGAKGRAEQTYTHELFANTSDKIETTERDCRGLVEKLQFLAERSEKAFRAHEGAGWNFMGRWIRLPGDHIKEISISPPDPFVKVELAGKPCELHFNLPGVFVSERQSETATSVDRYVKWLTTAFKWLKDMEKSGSLPEVTITRSKRRRKYSLIIPAWRPRVELTREMLDKAVPIGVDVGEAKHVVAGFDPQSGSYFDKQFPVEGLIDLRKKGNEFAEMVDGIVSKANRRLRKVKSEKGKLDVVEVYLKKLCRKELHHRRRKAKSKNKLDPAGYRKRLENNFERRLAAFKTALEREKKRLSKLRVDKDLDDVFYSIIDRTFRSRVGGPRRKVSSELHRVTREVAVFIRDKYECFKKPIVVAVEDVDPRSKPKILGHKFITGKTRKENDGARKENDGAQQIADKLMELLSHQGTQVSSILTNHLRTAINNVLKANEENIGKDAGDAWQTKEVIWLKTEEAGKHIWKEYKRLTEPRWVPFYPNHLHAALVQVIDHKVRENKAEVAVRENRRKTYSQFIKALKPKLEILESDGEPIPLFYCQVSKYKSSQLCHLCLKEGKRQGDQFICANPDCERSNAPVDPDWNACLVLAKRAVQLLKEDF